MLDTVSQIMIFASGISALWMLGSHRPRDRMIGGIIGLAGEPFWFYTLISHGQWIICSLAVVYGFNFSRIIWKNWLICRTEESMAKSARRRPDAGKSADATVPPGAKARIDGLWYKLGLHGKLYRWDGAYWVLSNRSTSDYLRAVEKTGT